jgi:molybdopterin molybdotransferase
MKGDKRAGVDEALARFLDWVRPIDRMTTISIDEADDRVLYSDIIAPMDYPHYDQCILDGYAVRTEDVNRCINDPGHPRLKVSDHVAESICKLIHTGDALPDGADAVLPLENACESDGFVRADTNLEPGKWVWNTGAGIRKKDLVFRKEMHLKPTDIAILGKLGIASVPVYDKPRVLIVPTGDELVKPGGFPNAGYVYEANGLMCSLLVKRYGGIPTLHDIVPDNAEDLRKALSSSHEFDLVLTIGGSSESKRDLMEEATITSGRLAFHNVSLHPGNHMGAGEIATAHGRTPLIFLPGYTESCAVAAFVFANAAIRKLGHYPALLPSRYRAVLEEKVNAPVGVRCVRKMCTRDGKATPVKLIADSARTGSYTYLVIPEDVSEYAAGTEIECTNLE